MFVGSTCRTGFNRFRPGRMKMAGAIARTISCTDAGIPPERFACRPAPTNVGGHSATKSSIPITQAARPAAQAASCTHSGSTSTHKPARLGFGVGADIHGLSCQLSVVSCQLSVVSCQLATESSSLAARRNGTDGTYGTQKTEDIHSH